MCLVEEDKNLYLIFPTSYENHYLNELEYF